MDLVELSRLAVVGGYAAVVAAGIIGWFRSTLYAHRLLAMSAVVVGSLWGSFYLVVSFFAPLDSNGLQLATYMSRVNHLPVIASFAMMLYTQRRTQQAINAVREQSDAQSVS